MKKEDEEEEVFFFQPAQSLVEEFIHLSQAKAIIDLTAGAGVWALAAVENNLPYFGLVLTDDHLEELTKFLVSKVRTKLCDPTSKLYMASLASKVTQPKKKAVTPKKRPNNPKKKKDKTKKDKKKKQKSSSSGKGSSSSDSDSVSPAK